MQRKWLLQHYLNNTGYLRSYDYYVCVCVCVCARACAGLGLKWSEVSHLTFCFNAILLLTSPAKKDVQVKHRLHLRFAVETSDGFQKGD